MTTHADARRYARIRYRLMLLDMAGGFALLWLYQASGASAAVASGMSRLTDSVWIQIAGYLAVFGAGWYLVFLPLHWHASFTLEHRFGLSRMTAKDWVLRELKQLALSGLFGVALIEAWYALLRGAPSSWPAYAAAGWVAISVLLARVFPTVLLPIFYKTAPVADDTLVRRLLGLCECAKVSALGVFRVAMGAETRKANAALAGMGGTRRVLVSDTLLERFTPEEIETVLGHELGHQRHRHIAKLLALSAAGSYLAFALIQVTVPAWLGRWGVSGLSDIAGFPVMMLALSAIGLVGMPVQNAVSRAFEWEADRFAVALTGKSEAFASALRRLGELNLADPAPPRWVEWMFYDHPPITQRIQAADAS